MSGSKVLIDSNIIIYLSKGVLEIEEIANHYDELCISIITYMEVLRAEKGQANFFIPFRQHDRTPYIRAFLNTLRFHWLLVIGCFAMFMDFLPVPFPRLSTPSNGRLALRREN
jgi:predicted nucleic acid-binding protein